MNKYYNKVIEIMLANAKELIEKGGDEFETGFRMAEAAAQLTLLGQPASSDYLGLKAHKNVTLKIVDEEAGDNFEFTVLDDEEK
jgi:hypothetical protein